MEKDRGKWLDAMYNNRELVPDFVDYVRRWDESSALAREQSDGALDIAYGPSPGESLDVFRAGTAASTARGGAPVLVFIHGGYWRALDKRGHSFVAPPFTREGVCVVVPNYTLAPAVTIPEITLQMVRAVAWTAMNIRQFGGDPGRITVAGHSAGGHLATMLLACRWKAHDRRLPTRTVRSSIAISALHDLEPIMHTPFLQPILQLTPDQVAIASPARIPAPPSGTLYSVAGGDESEEFIRQMRLIETAWGPRRVPVCEALAHLDHFSVLDAFVDPAHRLHRLALELVRA